MRSCGASVAVATVVVVKTLNAGRRAGACFAHLSGVAGSVTVTVAGASQHTFSTSTDSTVLAVTIASTACFAHFGGGVTDVAQRTVGVSAATFATLARFTNVRGAASVRGILVRGGAVGVSRAIHALVGGTLEPAGTVLGSVSTLQASSTAGLTSRGRSLALSIAGALGGDTLVALALLTGLAIAVGVALNTGFGSGVALERSTISVLGTTGSHTLIGFASLQGLAVTVLGASHTLVLYADRLRSRSAILIGATLAGLGHTRVGTDVTELPGSTVAVDHTSVASSAAQLTAFLVGILGAITVALAAGLGHTPVLHTEGLGCIFAVSISLTLRSRCHTLTVGITLGSGLFALGVRLALRRCFNAGAIVTNRLGWIELLTIFIVLTAGC